MATTKKVTTEPEKDNSVVVEETQQKSQPQKKSQKVNVLISVYRVNDKIISALGIPKVDAWVSHRFSKNKLRSEDLFMLTTYIKNQSPFNKLDSYKPVIEQILNNNSQEIVLPETKANQLQNIGTFTHEILNIGIELFS